MPYAKEPFRWGTWTIILGAVALSIYLWDHHRVNVYWWLGDLFAVDPPVVGALLGLIVSAALVGLLTGVFILLRQKSGWYRRTFRHRTKMGKVADWAMGIPALYFSYAMFFSVVALMLRLIG